MNFLEGIFNGTGGGLLDFMRGNAMNQQFGSGLASDQAQYGQQPMLQAPMFAAANQPSPLDNAQWPAGPVGAPSAEAAIPQNARPVQGLLAESATMQPQLPPALAPAQGGLGGAVRGFATNLHTGPIGALVGGIGGALGVESPHKENMRAQYQALVPILGEQRAALAILNPAIGQKLVEQATAGKQYGFTTLPDGTVIRTDAHSGAVEPAYQGGLKPTWGVVGEQDGQKTYGWIDPGKRTATPYQAPNAGADRSTIPGPDGKPIAIPPNVDRKAFVGEISRANAKAAAGEKTEVQAKSEKFGNKMELAEKNLKGIEGEGTGYLGRSASGFPLVGGTMATNWMKSDGYQKYEQARNNFITALLRDESGAAIGTDEFNRYEKELFPQPGDGPGVIKQKREARRIAIEGMKKAAGPGYKSPTFDEPDSTPKTKTGVSWSVE